MKSPVKKHPAKEDCFVGNNKYKANFPEKVFEYLKICKDEEYEFHKTRSENSNSFEQKIRVKLPTMGGLALYLGVHEATLYPWVKNHPEFALAAAHLKEIQKQRLLDNGLSGSYNHVIAKLILSSQHNIRDSADVTSNGKAISGNTIVFKDFSEEDTQKDDKQNE